MASRGFCFVLLVALIATYSVSVQRVRADEVKDVSEGLPKVEETAGAVPAGSTTDTQTEEREKQSMRRSGETFQFQAEVSRLMDIIIHSLYSNKDIFLRELISNASDALDKIRFLSLTDPSVLGEGEDAKLEITIKLDKENNVLRIRDRGIGMTKEDLVKNLGTIAKSGTSAFLEKMQKSGDLNLIGQFGVGFYSVFLVADTVDVRSKHNDDKQWVWSSAADGQFEVYEDEGEALGRGTELVIHLKEDAKESLTLDKLKELVKKYSEFINFPISLWSSKEVDVEVEDTEEEAKEKDEVETETEDEEKKDDEDKEDEEEKKPKTKTIKETQWGWEVLNDVKAIWLRSSKDVTEEEYSKFYKSISKDFSDKAPLARSHFSAEGDVEFKALLFIPPSAPFDFYDNYYSGKSNLKLYVRRVFISDDFEDLLPRYLQFLKGLVDSDTLPLNVSREMLQQHGSLKTIKKKLVRKALDMIRKLAEEEAEAKEKEVEKGEDDKDKDEEPGKYTTFWKEFGKALKLGVIEDASNRMRIAKLLRFHSTTSGDKTLSLDEYVERMKPGQKQIYYVTGSSREQLQKSPFLEKLLKKGYEVLLLTDPIDEYLMQNLTDYDDKKFQNASKEDLKIGGKKEKARKKATEESYKSLTKWWKEELGAGVEGVKVSDRLDNTPCVVVTSKYGWSANMERIMAAQALGDPTKQSYMKGRRTLEVNPRHPLVKQLKALVEANEKDETAKTVAKTLYETALLESGFTLEDPSKFASRVYDTLRGTLGVSPDAKVEEEEEVVEEEKAEGTAKEGADKTDEEDEEDGDVGAGGMFPGMDLEDVTEEMEDKEIEKGSFKDEL